MSNGRCLKISYFLPRLSYTWAKEEMSLPHPWLGSHALCFLCPSDHSTQHLTAGPSLGSMVLWTLPLLWALRWTWGRSSHKSFITLVSDKETDLSIHIQPVTAKTCLGHASSRLPLGSFHLYHSEFLLYSRIHFESNLIHYSLSHWYGTPPT